MVQRSSVDRCRAEYYPETLAIGPWSHGVIEECGWPDCAPMPHVRARSQFTVGRVVAGIIVRLEEVVVRVRPPSKVETRDRGRGVLPKRGSRPLTGHIPTELTP